MNRPTPNAPTQVDSAEGLRLQARRGAYFVNICAPDRGRLFGDIIDGEIRLNYAGRLVQATWDALPNRYPGVDNGQAFVVMLNQIHGVKQNRTPERDKPG